MSQNPIADIVDTQISQQRNSRIPFGELCGFYAALQWDASLDVVAAASTLNRSTIAYLKNAGSFAGGQIRYPKVRAEFDRLGKDQFSTQYLTPPLRDRLRVAADQVRRGKLAPKPFVGSNPRANAYAGRQAIKDPMGGPPVTVTIEFDRGARPGWTWREYAGRPEPLEGVTAYVLRGDPRRREQRFASSAECYEFCRLRFCPTEAEMDEPGYDAIADDTYFYQTIRSLRT